MAFRDDEQRLLELLHYKIGFNALARFTVRTDENPRLRSVRYQVASPRTAPDDPGPPWSPSGEMKVDAELMARVFAYALAHEDEPTAFNSTRMVFYDVLDRKHEGFQTFILLFLSPDIL